MRNLSAGVVVVVASVLVVILGAINFVQRRYQPRYQVPGQTYLVSKTTTQSSPSKNYYVFGQNRDEGQLVVTPDKKTAKQAATNADHFKQIYQGQSQQQGQVVGTIWTYEAGHHDLTVKSAPAGQPTNAHSVFSAKHLRFKHGQAVGQIKADDQVGNLQEHITMKRVNFNK